MRSFLFLHLLAIGVFAQSADSQCQSTCMTYLTSLENEKDCCNADVWDYSGSINANQVNTLCEGGEAIDCCACGGAGITGFVDTNISEMTILAVWALVCNTWKVSGAAEGADCWNSQLKSGCVDYNGLLEGGQCGATSSGNESTNTSTPPAITSTSVASISTPMASISTPVASSASTTTPSTFTNTTPSSSSGSTANSSAVATWAGDLHFTMLILSLGLVSTLPRLFLRL